VSHPLGGTPTIGLFDSSGTAHSGNALRGLVRAAAEFGLSTTVYAHPSVIPAPPRPDLTWNDVEGPSQTNEPESRRRHRELLIAAMTDFGPGPGRVFCDLGLDRTLGSRGPAIPADAHVVFVGHRVGALDRRPVRWHRRFNRNRSSNRAVLRQLGTAGARFVVHTEPVGARFADFVPADHVTRLGWPVASRHEPTLGPGWRPDVSDRMVLLAGSVRLEKGYEQFLRAAHELSGYDRLVVMGRVPKLLQDAFRDADPRVDFWDRWLTEDEYHQAFSTAALVAVPYVEHYAKFGTMSSVLLDALAHGRPALVAEPLAYLLPSDYAGAVVTDATDEAALSRGLASALADLDRLEAAAMGDGRRFIAEHHTYEAYLVGLARAGGIEIA